MSHPWGIVIGAIPWQFLTVMLTPVGTKSGHAQCSWCSHFPGCYRSEPWGNISGTPVRHLPWSQLPVADRRSSGLAQLSGAAHTSRPSPEGAQQNRKHSMCGLPLVCLHLLRVESHLINAQLMGSSRRCFCQCDKLWRRMDAAKASPVGSPILQHCCWLDIPPLAFGS